MENFGAVVAALIMFFGALALIAMLLGLPVMLLWNWLMPVIFGIKTITFWQAVGVNVLSGILFKSVNTTTTKK